MASWVVVVEMTTYSKEEEDSIPKDSGGASDSSWQWRPIDSSSF